MLYSNLTTNDEGHLLFAGQDTCALAKKYGTGLMLLDEDLIRARCREYITAMEEFLPAGSHPLYASKSLSFKLIQEDVILPKLQRGDLVAVLTTGAYNYSMASNYNRVPRLPIVMLREGRSYIAVRRETYADLLLCDQ